MRVDTVVVVVVLLLHFHQHYQDPIANVDFVERPPNGLAIAVVLYTRYWHYLKSPRLASPDMFLGL